VRIAGLAVLCAATLVAPALLLVWMPIVLGVPHIANDVRFLVLPLPRRQRLLAIAACGALVALKATSLVAGVHTVAYEAIVVAAWLVAALALEPRRQSHVHARHGAPARGMAMGGWLVIGAAAFAIVVLPVQFAIVAAFAHNFVALVAWVVVRRPERAHVGTVLVTVGLALIALVTLGPAIAAATGGAATRWLTVDRAAAVMFGGVPLATARGLMIGFAFLQAMHYAIWLDWMPRGQRTGLPRVALAAVALGTLSVVGAACVDAAWARTTYLALATFHVYLELVILGARGAARMDAARRLA
jgi:hypothetical protein